MFLRSSINTSLLILIAVGVPDRNDVAVGVQQHARTVCEYNGDDVAIRVDQVAVPGVVLDDEVPVDGHAEHVAVSVHYGGVPVPIGDDR